MPHAHNLSAAAGPHGPVSCPARRAGVLAMIVALLLTASTAVGPGTDRASAASSRSVLRASVVELTNAARLAAGCRPVTKHKNLRKAAQRHARDMARNDYFSHTSSDGREWDERIREAGYREPGGENIAHGYASAATVVQAWLDSPGHRRNIRNCEFRRIGIGYYADGDYWVQNFGY